MSKYVSAESVKSLAGIMDYVTNMLSGELKKDIEISKNLSSSIDLISEKLIKKFGDVM